MIVDADRLRGYAMRQRDLLDPQRFEVMDFGRKRGDDDNDCGDGTDELNCGSCDEGEFRCPQTRQCIIQSKVCDGHMDCIGTGADEYGCATNTGLWCHMREFRCGEGGCITATRVCDGRNDCRDLSDEEGCELRSGESFATVTPTTITTLAPRRSHNVEAEIARKARKVLPTSCGRRALPSFNHGSRLFQNHRGYSSLAAPSFYHSNSFSNHSNSSSSSNSSNSSYSSNPSNVFNSSNSSISSSSLFLE